LSFVAVFGSGIRDPGSGMGKNQDPGSGINIPDPQHCALQRFEFRNQGLFLPLLMKQQMGLVESFVGAGNFLLATQTKTRKHRAQIALWGERGRQIAGQIMARETNKIRNTDPPQHHNGQLLKRQDADECNRHTWERRSAEQSR